MARTLEKVFVVLGATISGLALFYLELTRGGTKTRRAERAAPVFTCAPVLVMHKSAAAFENIALCKR